MDVRDFFGNKEQGTQTEPDYVSSSDEEEEEFPSFTFKYILSKIIMNDYKPVRSKDPEFTTFTMLKKHINYKLDIEEPAVKITFTEKYLTELLKGLGFKFVKKVKCWNMVLKH